MTPLNPSTLHGFRLSDPQGQKTEDHDKDIDDDRQEQDVMKGERNGHFGSADRFNPFP